MKVPLTGLNNTLFSDMKTEFCDNEFCENEAVETVPVSVRQSGDSERKFCAPCYEAYVIGVQHGRISENPKAYSRNQTARLK
jgi:hypothetical protein